MLFVIWSEGSCYAFLPTLG